MVYTGLLEFESADADKFKNSLEKLDGVLKNVADTFEIAGSQILIFEQNMINGAKSVNDFKVNALVEGVKSAIIQFGTFYIAVIMAGDAMKFASIQSAGLRMALQALSTAGIMLVVTIVVQLIALLVQWVQNIQAAEEKNSALNQSLDAQKTALEGAAEAVNNYLEGIKTANTVQLDFFDPEYVLRVEEMLAEEIEAREAAREAIASIDEEAYRNMNTAERREYNEKLRIIEEANQKELELLQQHSEEKKRMAEAELLALQSNVEVQREIALLEAENRDMDLDDYLENAQTRIATLQAQNEEEQRLIREIAEADIAAMHARIGMDGYTQEQFEADAQKRLATMNEDLNNTNAYMADVTAAYADGYAALAEERGVDLEAQANYAKAVEELETTHAEKMGELKSQKYAAEQSGDEDLANVLEARLKHEQELYEQEMARLKTELEDANTNASAILVAMAGMTEDYGGQVSDSTQETVDSILESYENLPPECYEAGVNMMEGILGGLNNREGAVYQKIQSICQNMLATMKAELEEASPSKATRRIFRYVMEGAELGLEDEEKPLYSQTEGIAKGVLKRFGDLSRAVVGGAVGRLQAAAAYNQQRFVPAMAGAYGGGASTYVDNSTHLEQTIHSGKALQPSEMTRNAEDLLRRAKWQIK